MSVFSRIIRIAVWAVVLCSFASSSCRHKASADRMELESSQTPDTCFYSFDLSTAAETASNIIINTIVDSMEFIPLEFDLNAPVRLEYLMTVETDDGLLLANNCTRWFRGVLLFSKTGEFRRTVIGMGHGHNELPPDYYRWSYSKENNELLMYSRGICYVYSSVENEGKYLKTDEAIVDIIPTENSNYMIRPASAQYEDNPYLKLVDRSGKELKAFRHEKKKNIYYETPPYDVGPNEHYLLRQGGRGEILFKDLFNDTIYVYENDYLSPRFALNAHDNRPNIKDVSNKQRKMNQIYLSDIATVGKYLLCQYEYAGEIFNQLVFDCSTRKVVCSSLFKLSMRGAGTTHSYRNRFPFQLQTPTGNTIWIGITGFGNGVIYGVANPVDVSDFLGTDAESNPVLIKMYL